MIKGKQDVCLQVWNRPEWTERVLKSIFSNTDWNRVHRFYIMDDNSEKETKQVLRKFRNEKIQLVSKKFGGSLQSLRKFIEIAQTEWVFICENDILVPYHWNSILMDNCSKEFDIVRGVSQDLPEEKNYTTCHAGFKLEFLKKILSKLVSVDEKWTNDGFGLLGKICVIPEIEMDKLEYHLEEFPTIHRYFEKGWERVDIDNWTRFLVIFKHRFSGIDLNELIGRGSYVENLTDMCPFSAVLAGLVIALDARVVLEIGTGHLNSAKSFLYGLEKTDGILYSCDPIKEWPSFVHPRFRYFQQSSRELSKTWSHQIDCLFIDGNHSFSECKKDFLEFSPFVRVGGLVIFHDTCSQFEFGCEHFVKEIDLKNFQRIKFPKNPGLTIFQKIGGDIDELSKRTTR